MTLAACALDYGFGRRIVGRGMELTLAPGRIACLLGANGSGTTTLLRTLLGLVAPLVVYPVFLMKVLCFALFACAFNLLIGYVGLLSFGHAMFFGLSAYITAHTVKWSKTRRQIS